MVPWDGDSQQVPVNQLDPGTWLEILLAEPALSCCSFQGGYCLFVDGEAWNGDADSLSGELCFCFDEFWMTTSWLNALQRLLAGESGPVLMAYWEESRAEMAWYPPDLLTLIDKHHTGVIYPEVLLPLEDFYVALCEATEQYLDFCTALEPVLAGQHMPEATRGLIQKEMQPEVFRAQLNRLRLLWQSQHQP